MNKIRDQLLDIIWKADKTACYQAIKNSVYSIGWIETWSSLQEILDKFYGAFWYSKRRFLFGLFDCHHLRGFEGSIMELLNMVSETNDFEEVKSSFEVRIIQALTKQLRDFGSNRFFDVSEISMSRHAGVVQDLIRARKKDVIRLLQRYYNQGGFQNDTKYLNVDFLHISEYLSPVLPEETHHVSPNDRQLIEKSLGTIMEELDITLEMIQNDLVDYEKETTSKTSQSERITTVRNLFEVITSIKNGNFRKRSHDFRRVAATGYFETNDILNQYFKFISSLSDEYDLYDVHFEFLDFGTIDYSTFSNDIVPYALEEIGRSRNPDKTEILLKSIKTIHFHSSGVYPIHEVAFKYLREFDQKEVVDQIVEWVNNLTYDFSAEGCRDVSVWIQDTSFEALEVAIDICVKHHRIEILKQLESFMEILQWTEPWPLGGLGDVAVQAYAKLRGIDAFNSLIDRLEWHHRKWDCGFQTDQRIVDVIVEMGKEVVPHLENHLYTEWGINNGVVEILERLGEDPSDYYRISTVGYEIGFEMAGELLTLMLKTNRKRAIEELMYYHATHSCPSKVSMKKFMDDLDLIPSSDELSHLLKHEDMRIARGAANLANLFLSTEDRSTVLDVIKSNASTPELVLILIESDGIGQLPLYLAWLSSQLTELGLSPNYDDLDEWLLQPFFEVIRTIARMIIQSGANSLQQILSNLSNKDWKHRASSLFILLDISHEEDGKALLRENDLNDFVDGFIAQVESIFQLPRDSDSYSYNPSESLVVDFRLRQFILDIARLDFPVLSRQVEEGDIIKIIKESSKPISLISTLIKSEDESQTSPFISVISDRIVTDFAAEKNRWRLVDIIKSIIRQLNQDERVNFEIGVIDALISDATTTPLSLLETIIRQLAFSDESVASQNVVTYLLDGEVPLENVPRYLDYLSESKKLIVNPLVLEHIDRLREVLTRTIEKTEDRIQLGQLVQRIFQSKHLCVDDTLQQAIDAKSTREPYRTEIKNVQNRIASQSEDQRNIEHEQKFSNVKLNLQSDLLRSLDYDVRVLSKTEYFDDLISALIIYCQTYQITNAFLSTLAAIEQVDMSDDLITALHFRLDDITTIVRETTDFYRILPTLSKLGLLSETAILESLVDRLITSENPLGKIDFVKKTLDAEPIVIFSSIVQDNVKIDPSDFLKEINLDSITDSFLLLSIDTRILTTVKKEVTDRRFSYHNMKSLTHYFPLFYSQSLNTVLEGKIPEYIQALKQKEINMDLLECTLKIPVLINNKQIQEILVHVINELICKPHNPDYFQKIIQLLAGHLSNPVVKKIRALVQPYIDLL